MQGSCLLCFIVRPYDMKQSEFIVILYTYKLAQIMTKRSIALKLLLITLVLFSVVSGLKHPKKAAASTTPEPNKTSPETISQNKPATSVQVKQKSEVKQEAVVDKPKAEATKKQEEKTKQQQKKQGTDSKNSAKNKKQYYIQESGNQYVMPVKIGEKTFNLSMYYGEDNDQYGKLPSWIFTSMSKEHELCDANDDCSQVEQFIKCQSEKSKAIESTCSLEGKAKFSSDLLKSAKKVKVSFSNNLKTYQSSFVSPEKATLNYCVVGDDRIVGFINLALNDQQKYGNCLTINNSIITIVQKEEFEQLLEENTAIDLNKAGMLSFSGNKDIYLRTKNVKDNKVTNSIKDSYKKIKVGFNKVHSLMSVTKSMMVVIKNILKKQFFGDRCKIKDNKIACSAEPVKNITELSFCRSDDDKKCINLKILGQVVSEIKSGVSYKLLIDQNKEGDDSLILYPKFAEYFEIFAEDGLVKGVMELEKKTKSTENKKQDKNEQKSEQQQQQSEQEEQKTDKQTKKQQQKTKQEKKSEKKTEEEAKNQKANHKQAKSDKQQEQKQTQQQQNEEQDQQQEKTPSKNKKDAVKKIESKLNAKGTLEEQQKYSRGILFFTVLYGGMFILILVVIKWKAAESAAAAAIDRFLEVTWYAIVQNYFNKNQGYNAPSLDEDEPKANQQIDRSDSIAVGYSYKQGKQLFWENNSVEGI